MPSLFYTFVVLLTLTILLFTAMCVANLLIHFWEVEGDPGNVGLTTWGILRLVFRRYWVSLVGSLIAVLVSAGLVSTHPAAVQRLRVRPVRLPHLHHLQEPDYAGEAEAYV